MSHEEHTTGVRSFKINIAPDLQDSLMGSLKIWFKTARVAKNVKWSEKEKLHAGGAEINFCNSGVEKKVERFITS